MEDKTDDWDGKKHSRCQKEIHSAFYYLLLEHDITGLLVALFNKLRVFRRRWNLKFTLQRRVIHLVVCVLITLVLQATFYLKHDLCMRRRHCLRDACLADNAKRQPSVDAADTAAEKAVNKIRSCDPIPSTDFRVGDANRQWFVYPRPSDSDSGEWTKCSVQGEEAEKPNVCVKGVVCLPACKAKTGARTFLPDQRSSCAKKKSDDIISKISYRNLRHTLVCVYPYLPCFSHAFSALERRSIVAAGYVLVSLVTRLLLVCSCVRKPTTRRHYRRLGYFACVLIGGGLAGLYGFILMETTYIKFWLLDTILALMLGYAFQAVWIVFVGWCVLGSCGPCSAGKSGCCRSCRRTTVHVMNQICGGKRKRAVEYDSPFVGVMETCGQKTLTVGIGQKEREINDEDSGSYDTVADDEDFD